MTTGYDKPKAPEMTLQERPRLVMNLSFAARGWTASGNLLLYDIRVSTFSLIRLL